MSGRRAYPRGATATGHGDPANRRDATLPAITRPSGPRWLDPTTSAVGRCFLREIMQTLGGGAAQHGDVSPLEVGRRFGGSVRSGLLRSGPQLSRAEPERRLGRLVHACDEQWFAERPRQGRAEGNGVTALQAPVISDDDRHGLRRPFPGQGARDVESGQDADGVVAVRLDDHQVGDLVL